MPCQRSEAEDNNAERGRVGGDWDDRDGQPAASTLKQETTCEDEQGVEAGEAGEKKKAEKCLPSASPYNNTIQ